jgi:hypothetical protein
LRRAEAGIQGAPDLEIWVLGHVSVQQLYHELETSFSVIFILLRGDLSKIPCTAFIPLCRGSSTYSFEIFQFVLCGIAKFDQRVIPSALLCALTHNGADFLVGHS